MLAVSALVVLVHRSASVLCVGLRLVAPVCLRVASFCSAWAVWVVLVLWFGRGLLPYAPMTLQRLPGLLVLSGLGKFMFWVAIEGEGAAVVGLEVFGRVFRSPGNLKHFLGSLGDTREVRWIFLVSRGCLYRWVAGLCFSRVSSE